MEKESKENIEKSNPAEPKADAKPDMKPETKPSWAHINTDLKSSLDTWSELNEKLADKIPPDQEHLQEIKSILGTLKDQLKEFSDDN